MVRAICIKEYQDEDDIDLYANGEIEEVDIKVYQVGEEGMVEPDYCNKKYWKLKT